MTLGVIPLVAPWLGGIKGCVRCISSLLLDALLKVSICTRCRRARLTVGFRDACMLSSLGELAQGVLPMPRGARPLSLFFSQCPAPRFGGGCIVACLGIWVRRARAVFVLCNISLLSGITKQTVCARVLLQLWPPRLEYGDGWYSVCSTCDRGSAGSVVVPFVVLFAAFQFLGSLVHR